jgi:flagellar protein FlaG
MRVQATTSATSPTQTASPQATAQADVAAAATATANARPAPKVEHVRLHHPERVDLGFRAEELRKNLQAAVTRLNDQMQSKGRDLSFSVDETIDRTIITVKNLQTGEVVRQIPTEEVVRMAHSIEDMKGLLFNQTL